jgi:hypothetical protein
LNILHHHQPVESYAFPITLHKFPKFTHLETTGGSAGRGCYFSDRIADEKYIKERAYYDTKNDCPFPKPKHNILG